MCGTRELELIRIPWEVRSFDPARGRPASGKPATRQSCHPCVRSELKAPCAVTFSGFGSAADIAENKLQQIEEDQRVDDEQTGANPGEAADDFEDLKGQEGSSDGEGEELAPGFLEIEADAFGEGDASVGEGDEADAAEEGVIKERGFRRG